MWGLGLILGPAMGGYLAQVSLQSSMKRFNTSVALKSSEVYDRAL